MFPDFSLIKFVITGKNPKKPVSGEKTDLYKFFDAIVNGYNLEIDQFILDEIFVKDLAIDTKKYDKILVSVLAEALIYFMTLWPGWANSNDYYTGKVQSKEWYEKFKNYLIVKITHIINNASKYSKKDKIQYRHSALQTDLFELNGGKRIAPYVLCVGGPPNVLNNVVFVETGGNVFIKQHAEKSWPRIQMQELINWPYVTLEVKLPDLAITRSNTHQMPRYLVLCGDTTVFPEVDAIKHIKRLPDCEEKQLQPYSYDFYSSYFEELKETLKLLPGVDSERLSELATIFKEFLLDIKEVDLYNNTMCPYLSVAFHIGKCKYLRNKKVSAAAGRKESEGLNFCEIFIPEVDFGLSYFNVVQDDTDTENITFVSLNNLKNTIKDSPKSDEIENLCTFINHASVSYNCTLCEEIFTGHQAYSNLYSHFESLHKCEQTLLCHKCHKPFDVQFLTSKRWYHSC